MNTGGLAHMSHSNFDAIGGMELPGCLAARRGGHNIKPLTFDNLDAPSAERDCGVPTPRTSRSHLLAGLRTAPKTATATVFPNQCSSDYMAGPQAWNRDSLAGGMYDNANLYSGPKTALPRHSVGQKQQTYLPTMGFVQQQPYNPESMVVTPLTPLDNGMVNSTDPHMQAQLMMANAILSERQQLLQQQLRQLQAAAAQHAAAQQFQGLNTSQNYAGLYQQQQAVQQLQSLQAMMAAQQQQQQQAGMYAFLDPITCQQTLYVDDPSKPQHANSVSTDQAQFSGFSNDPTSQSSALNTPRVQISSPSPENMWPSSRNTSPPRRFGSPLENPAPLPPPSANAFRRGHKKAPSLVNSNGLLVAVEEPFKCAGLRTASFPLTPSSAHSYGPGQARAGEHPVRQPHNPPSLDELRAKPTSLFEGSKNFVSHTRDCSTPSLAHAGLERHEDTRSSGSISHMSEITDELVQTSMTDNESDSGRSGSGSLVEDDVECSLPSSRTSTASWGAIGSDRPSSRQKNGPGSVDSNDNSDNEGIREINNSFASLLRQKNGVLKVEEKLEDQQRKAPMFVLTSVEKRKPSP